VRLTAAEVRGLRLYSQGLLGNGELPPDGIAETVSRLVGVQAQQGLSAALGLWARGHGSTLAGVEAARLEARSIVRTWAMRGTLHLLATHDLRWLMPLLGPRVIAASRRRYRELGLGEMELARSADVLEEALEKRGPTVRKDLALLLSEYGLPNEGQATYHLLRHAGLLGRVCMGPDREGQETYVALPEWLKLAWAEPEEGAVAELLRRYWRGYGPASLEDAATWSGLTMTQVRGGFELIREGLVKVLLDEGEAWAERQALEAVGELGANSVKLIPAYDGYLLGYRSRGWMVEPAEARRIHPGGGLLRPTLLVAGRAGGTWKLGRSEREMVVEVEPFAPLAGPTIEALEAEVEALSGFFGKGTALRLA
jgi:hypothetical protein